MGWISFLLFFMSTTFAAAPEKFLTKQSLESIRYITMDGRFAYVQKSPGVLGLVNNFRSTDFISDSSTSDFLVSGSRFKKRILIEVIPNAHNELNLLKESKISVVDWGGYNAKEIGKGSNAQLQLNDEWLSYYRPYDKEIVVHNIITQKRFSIRLNPKANQFFVPEVEMVTGDTVVYTDINEKGYSAFIAYNLTTQKSNVLYKSPQTGTRMELCQNEGYLAIGEFPFDGVKRGSKILQIKLTSSTNLAGFSTLYSSVDPDIGNMSCLSNSIYFVKTMNFNERLNLKTSEAVKLDLKTLQIEAKTALNHVTQIIEMDGRILVPFRGEFYVLEGVSRLTDDRLKSTPSSKSEELPFEI